jgi:hypothetical protein
MRAEPAGERGIRYAGAEKERAMKGPKTLLWVAAVLLASVTVFASGSIGLYGIVERVVFEPNAEAPERIQVFGAFAYVEGAGIQGLQVSAAKRGYLYFRIRSDIPGFTSQAQVDVTKKEWADLKAVAGTGQAIAFGRWGYIGGFGVLQPDIIAPRPSFLYEHKPSGGAEADLRVRPADEPPSKPVTYQTNTGIVKLSDSGSYAAIVKQLRDALKR